MSKLIKYVDGLEREYLAARKTLRKEKGALKKAGRELRHTKEAQRIIQLVAQSVQQKAHDQIAGVVSRCLEAVFDEPYEFKIEFERKRGRTEARLVFVRDGKEIDPKDGVGGGVVDVAAFALRLACLVLQRPKGRQILLLDEPFKFVSERNDYRKRVAELLITLAKEMKIQIIMVTHDPILQVGHVLEVE